MEESVADMRPRRGASRSARSIAKPSMRELSNPSHDGGSSADEEEEEEEEEEEIEEEEDEPVDEADEAELDAIDAAYRISPTARELHTLDQGTLVRVLKTPDVEQRVPHTVHKVGVVEEVPLHPNTWFKVRIRDGDVVYKYRPSALEVLEDGDDVGSPGASPVVHQEETSQHDDAEDEEDEGEQKEASVVGRLELGTRVLVKLDTLNAVEKRYLKNYQGKEGVVTGHGRGGVNVQMDGDEDITVTLRQKHLVVVPDEQEDEEEEEEEEQVEEEKKPVVTQKKRRGKGKLLSTLDPDMWIDRKCRINVGKFKGQHGRVLRSGNGWVQLKLENSSENTAKRAYELTLLEDMETIKKLHAKSLEKERKRRAESRANGTSAGDDGDDEDDDDEANQSGTDDLLAADQSDDSQGEDNGKRVRRVSTRGNYGISWIEKKVNLPNRKGFGIVKKADRDTCTVAIQTTKVLQVFKKKDLQLAGDSHAKTARQNSRNRNTAKAREKLGLGEDVVLMGTTPSRYIAFQDLVKKFAMRRREKLKKRPNLIEWEARLNLHYLENGFWDKSDPSVVDLVVVPQCEICGVEKEDMGGHCWNNECPRSPAFDVSLFDPKNEDALMRIPAAPFTNDSITSALCLQKEDLSRKRKRRSLDAPATGTSQPGAEQLTSPTSDSKKAKREATKSKKNPTDKDTGKKHGITSKAVVKKEDADTGVSTEAAETGETSPSSTFRPHYDSVFSR